MATWGRRQLGAGGGSQATGVSPSGWAMTTIRWQTAPGSAFASKLPLDGVDAQMDHGGPPVRARAGRDAALQLPDQFDLLGGPEHLPGLDRRALAHAGHQTRLSRLV